MSSPAERIRHEWYELQPWLEKMRDEEESRRKKEFEDLRQATERRIQTQGSRSDPVSTIQADFERENAVIWDEREYRIMSRGSQEWKLRLQRAGLKMEQWIDITEEENKEVAAVIWGTGNEYEEASIASVSSDENETVASSASITPTPSLSSRGPQLWTPPEISRVAELPASNSNSNRGSLDEPRNNGDKTPPARRSPTLAPNSRVVIPKLRNNARVAPAHVVRESNMPWEDDDVTLLATSREVTEDESDGNTDVSPS
jgi:hypothetical protein